MTNSKYDEAISSQSSASSRAGKSSSSACLVSSSAHLVSAQLPSGELRVSLLRSPSGVPGALVGLSVPAFGVAVARLEFSLPSGMGKKASGLFWAREGGAHKLGASCTSRLRPHRRPRGADACGVRMQLWRACAWVCGSADARRVWWGAARRGRRAVGLRRERGRFWCVVTQFKLFPPRSSCAEVVCAEVVSFVRRSLRLSSGGCKPHGRRILV